MWGWQLAISTSPASPFAATVELSAPIRHTVSPAPNWMRSPAASRFAEVRHDEMGHRDAYKAALVKFTQEIKE